MDNMKTTIQAMDMSRGFQLHNLGDGFTLSIGFGADHYCQTTVRQQHHQIWATETMEVAVMRGGSFVALPYDVAGHVPVSNLGSLIEAVSSHDWERVLILCGQTGEPDFSKFPTKPKPAT